LKDEKLRSIEQPMPAGGEIDPVFFSRDKTIRSVELRFANELVDFTEFVPVMIPERPSEDGFES